jgi:hypothetical protein
MRLGLDSLSGLGFCQGSEPDRGAIAVRQAAVSFLTVPVPM